MSLKRGSAVRRTRARDRALGPGGCTASDRPGFTLLEVAVAMAIVGLGVVTVLQLFSAALRMETAAGVRTRAVAYAGALFDQALATPEINPAIESGQYEDGFRWERAIREAPELTDDAGDTFEFQSAITMYEIEVSVLWPQGADREGVYTLRALRVGPRLGP